MGGLGICWGFTATFWGYRDMNMYICTFVYIH